MMRAYKICYPKEFLSNKFVACFLTIISIDKNCVYPQKVLVRIFFSFIFRELGKNMQLAKNSRVYFSGIEKNCIFAEK